MNWLTTNPLFTMAGPPFLFLYATLWLFAFWLCRRSRRSRDQSGELPSLQVPSDPDPYKIAYLRGGAPEVIRLATLDLMDRGSLTEQRKWFSGMKLVATDAKMPGTDEPILRELAEFYRSPQPPTQIFKTKLNSVSEKSEAWDKWIEKESLRIDQDQVSMHGTVVRSCVVGLLIIGALKLITALWTGHDNIVILIFMMIGGPLILMMSTSLPKFSARGRRFIEDLQTAFAPFRQVPASYTRGDLRGSVNALTSPSTDLALPVIAMGIFGITALQGSPFNSLYGVYAQAASNGSSCGSCGSSDGGGDGGGGGCGGGCGGCGGGD